MRYKARPFVHSALMQPAETTTDRRSRTDRRLRARSPIVEELHAALARDEIEVLFQPQFACSDGTLVGAEALARWQHPERGRLGADRLLGLAHRAGLIEQVSHHVVRRALGTAGNWPVPLRLSLNVTAADVASGNFAETIARAVADAGFPPEHLTLEITEQVLLTDLDRTAARLQDLSGLGIAIALDDFGAGFCNFDYLKRLPLDYLKLDRAMVQGIESDSRDLAVLRGIMAMAQALDLQVIAEGIERPDQLEAVVREGCASWQGFLGGRPMAAEEFAALAF